MKIKNLIALFLILSLAFLSAGCGSTPAQAQATPTPTQAPTATPAASPAQTAAAEAPAEPAQENKSLVVVFSCTGTTKGVAEKIAALTGAELVDLVPAQPYTAEDLNYNDRSTRATVEQNTPDARPEIAEDISLDGVTTLYLGYHLQNAKNNGVTKAEIAAIITHATMYVGWPKGWAVFRQAEEIWNEEV